MLPKSRGIKAVNGLLFDGAGCSADPDLQRCTAGSCRPLSVDLSLKHRPADCGSRAVFLSRIRFYGNSGRIRALAPLKPCVRGGSGFSRCVLTGMITSPFADTTTAAFCGIAHNLERCGSASALLSAETTALNRQPLVAPEASRQGRGFNCIIAVASKAP